MPVPVVISELENMANVDTINTRHSINSGALPDHSDLEESGNDPDPDRIFTTQPGTAPNPRSADGGVSHSGEGGGNWSMTPDQVDQIRRRVKFFFMDPWSKFKARQHLPWKMFFQLLKIIIVTVQVWQLKLTASLTVLSTQCNTASYKPLGISVMWFLTS